MLLKIRTRVNIRVHILRVNVQLSNQSDRGDTDAQIVQHRGETLHFFREKKICMKKNREEKVFRVYNPNTVSGQKGERKKKKVLHKTISESIHHGEFIRRVARTNLEQYA